MSSKVIIGCIVFLTVILIFSIFVLVRIDDPNSFVNSRNRGTDDVLSASDQLVGAWVNVAPDSDGSQGFVLNGDGSAASINIHALLYKRWYVDGESLVLTADSVEDGNSTEVGQRFVIESVNDEKLLLKNGDLTIEYTRESVDAVEVVPNRLGGADLKPIVSEEVSYYGDTKGYFVRPDDDGEYPGLILIHEWWGLNNNIRSLAEDFAALGYAALAVDLYDGEFATTPEEAGALAGAVREDVDEAFNNLNAAVVYLSTADSVNADALASVGWCFGGGWAYEMARNDLGIDASVMYYGRFSAEDDLSMMRADILGHFGEEDTSILIDDVKEFEAKLETHEGKHAVFIYPNAGHAFANKDNEDAYREDAAQLAWQRTQEFLTRELSVPPPEERDEASTSTATSTEETEIGE